MNLDQIHDILMDGYLAIKHNENLKARLILGCAAGLLREEEFTPEINCLYKDLHQIRRRLKNWPANKDISLEAASEQVRIVQKWRAV